MPNIYEYKSNAWMLTRVNEGERAAACGSCTSAG
jgi:hypothetical protein